MSVRAFRSSCSGIRFILKVTVPRKTIGQSSFSVAGPQMWNDLPINVRSTQSLTLCIMLMHRSSFFNFTCYVLFVESNKLQL